MDASLKLTGSKELRANLDKLSFNMAQKARINAVRAGARVVLDEAQSIVPIGESWRLFHSLAVKADKADEVEEKSQAYVYSKPGKRRDDPDGAYYGIFVEEGTSSIDGKHFIERAMKGKAQAALDALAESLKRSIKRFSK